MDMDYGAAIERGTILTAADGEYTVASADRDGIMTPRITGIDNTTYTVGDTVYFFLFRDGTGKILGKV